MSLRHAESSVGTFDSMHSDEQWWAAATQQRQIERSKGVDSANARREGSMQGDTLARQIGGGHIEQAALAGTLGAVSALQRELAPETLGELSSALEQLQLATAELHQEHEQLTIMRAVEEE